MQSTRDSNLYIAITGHSSEFDEFSKMKIIRAFNDLFGQTSKKVSLARETENTEIIYEIQTPVFDDDGTSKEFYENLEVLLDELKEFNPHFTQFRRYSINAHRESQTN